jgi:hypothetical protein
MTNCKRVPGYHNLVVFQSPLFPSVLPFICLRPWTPLPVFACPYALTEANISHISKSSCPYLSSTLKQAKSLTNSMNDRDHSNVGTSIPNRAAMSLPLPSQKSRARLKHQPFPRQRFLSQSLPYPASHSPPWSAPTSLPLCHLWISCCAPPLPRCRSSPTPSHHFFRQIRTLWSVWH